MREKNHALYLIRKNSESSSKHSLRKVKGKKKKENTQKKRWKKTHKIINNECLWLITDYF